MTAVAADRPAPSHQQTTLVFSTPVEPQPEPHGRAATTPAVVDPFAVPAEVEGGAAD
ncbi:hypothetical protein [Catellatospora sp. NPDC049609]|uniref:hypothetical protein n=1 Tax=Catellatospora sp. NPDC049609 TaxID=3155505 RepID=UPI00342D6323